MEELTEYAKLLPKPDKSEAVKLFESQQHSAKIKEAALQTQRQEPKKEQEQVIRYNKYLGLTHEELAKKAVKKHVKYKAFKESNKKLEKKQTGLEADYETHEKILKGVVQTNSTLSENRKNLESRNTELSEKIENATKEKQELTGLIGTLNSQLQQLTLQNTQLTTQYDQLKSQYESQKSWFQAASDSQPGSPRSAQTPDTPKEQRMKIN